MVVRRFDVWLVNLDPMVASETRKTRPALAISPDEMNAQIPIVIIAAMTTKGRHSPTRVPGTFQEKSGQVVLDQLRTVDEERLVKRLGEIETGTAEAVIGTLAELFAK